MGTKGNEKEPELKEDDADENEVKDEAKNDDDDDDDDDNDDDANIKLLLLLLLCCCCCLELVCLLRAYLCSPFFSSRVREYQCHH